MHDMEQLLLTYGPAMRRLAASYMPPGPGREDLEQEIYLAIHKGMLVFRGDCSERTYIYRIAHGCALRQRARLASPLEATEVEGLDPSPSPEQRLLVEERSARLARSLRSLPIILRQPLMMRLEGMSYQEIAEILDTELHHVTARIHRGTRALRDMMQEVE